MILTELNDNPSTSVTTMVEILAAELITKHFPQRFEAVDEEPVVLIEHDEPPVVDKRGKQGKLTYDRVRFGSWRPRRICLGGQERVSLGEPDWKHLSEDAVRELRGADPVAEFLALLRAPRTPAPNLAPV